MHYPNYYKSINKANISSPSYSVSEQVI